MSEIDTGANQDRPGLHRRRLHERFNQPVLIADIKHEMMVEPETYPQVRTEIERPVMLETFDSLTIAR